MRKWIPGLLVAGLAFGQASPASAHAFGERYDLPVPLALYLAGAGATIALSFVVISLFVRGTGWSRAYPRLNLLGYPPGRVLANPLVLFGLKLAAVLLFILVLAAGLLGSQQPMRNVAPTLVWVIWWVGLAVLSAFLGNLWALINPWRSLFAWSEAIYHRLSGGRTLALGLSYPEALGVWPAVALFLAFAWLELVFPAPAVPANIAWMALGYSAVTWAGMWVFGRERWLKQAEVFSLYFGLLARFAPFEIRVRPPQPCAACGLGCRDLDGDCVNCTTCFARVAPPQREWVLRPYAIGLLRNDPPSISMVAFALLAMATVVADGALATPAWQVAEGALVGLLPEPGGLAQPVARTLGLACIWLAFLGAYAAVSLVMQAASDGRLAAATIARRFVFTLVPITIAYHLAHYLSFLLIQGQYLIPLASDPFGYGWDLFGTAGYRVDIAVVGARFAWYLAVSAIVGGHVVAVFLAHQQAMMLLPDRRPALRSQLPMTALMVMFTVLSLSILAEPIVERMPANATTHAPDAAAIVVPADALLPEPATGRLRPVGQGRTAKLALRYGAMSSLFHDGTRTEVADILYPFAVAYRWGVRSGDGDGQYDPAVDAATALVRERLVALRPVGTDKVSKTFRVGELEFVREMLLVEVYLNAASPDLMQAAALAPPWSSLPWHVTALMEEAVARGWAAFSDKEAKRRGVPWLDMVRDSALQERLSALVREFAREGFVPAPLQGMVSPAEARARWEALEAFHRGHGHFLATNGPYTLKFWSPQATVLEVFRDVSYPLGVGSYDAYALPRRAYIAEVKREEGGLKVAAEIERVEKFARSYKIVREAITDRGALEGETLECRYVVIADDGTTARAGLGLLEEDGGFLVQLDAEHLTPGRYTVLLTLVLNGNTVDPDIRLLPYQVR